MSLLVYELGSNANETKALSSELGDMNFLLFPAESLDLAVLSTVADFRLAAGSLQFVLGYVESPETARDAFVDFVESHPAEELHPMLRRAAAYMDWAGKAAP